MSQTDEGLGRTTLACQCTPGMQNTKRMNISGSATVAMPEMLFYTPGDLTVTLRIPLTLIVVERCETFHHYYPIEVYTPLDLTVTILCIFYFWDFSGFLPCCLGSWVWGT